MMEPVTFSPQVLHTTEKPWATTGKPATRKRNIINSLYLDADTLEQHVLHLFEKFARMEAEEQRSELYLTDDQPEIVICAFGTTARIAKSAIKVLRSQGISVGLFRPITAWPFPEAAFQTLVGPTKAFLSIEMSMGQLVQDIRTLVAGRKPVEFWGRTGGVVPTTEEMVAQVQKLHAKLAAQG
jgi:2-oxoglutarate ferredoxin oxidoreductase subunit alpha